MHSPKSDLVGTLRRLPLFTELSNQELELVAENVSRRHYGAGSRIFSEGDPCHELLIVEQGAVRILKSAPEGRQQLIEIERRGNSLAEVPVFDGGCYPASAEAAGPAILLRLPAHEFRRLCLQNPELALKVFKVLGHRLRHLMNLVEELSFSTVRSRLIGHLLRLADETGHPSSRGIQFELNENNEELAARLGTVRELVSRNLGRLHGSGLIEMNRRTINLPNPEALRVEVAKTR